MKTTILSAGVLVTAISTQAISIEVRPASSPNGFGSPSYNGWVANAVSALHSGATTAGTPGTPTYYSQISGPMQVSDNIVTGFPSWKGQADPGTNFGPAFASELGNRVLFGLVIDGEGTQFSISELSFVMDSTDPLNSLDFTFGLGAYNYSTQYVGVLYGGDGQMGGGDDTFITGGANTQLVDGLVGRGSGNAWAVYDADPGATRQDKINIALSHPMFDQDFTFNGTYTLRGETGSATVEFLAVPEAGATALMLGLAALGLRLARRNKR